MFIFCFGESKKHCIMAAIIVILLCSLCSARSILLFSSAALFSSIWTLSVRLLSIFSSLVDVAEDFLNLVQRVLRTRLCLALHCISIIASSCFLVLSAASIICGVALSAFGASGTFWNYFTFSYNLLSTTTSTFEIVRAVFGLMFVLESFEALYYRGFKSRSLTSLSLVENCNSSSSSISGSFLFSEYSYESRRLVGRTTCYSMELLSKKLGLEVCSIKARVESLYRVLVFVQGSSLYRVRNLVFVQLKGARSCSKIESERWGVQCPQLRSFSVSGWTS